MEPLALIFLGTTLVSILVYFWISYLYKHDRIE